MVHDLKSRKMIFYHQKIKNYTVQMIAGSARPYWSSGAGGSCLDDVNRYVKGSAQSGSGGPAGSGGRSRNGGQNRGVFFPGWDVLFSWWHIGAARRHPARTPSVPPGQAIIKTPHPSQHPAPHACEPGHPRDLKPAGAKVIRPAPRRPRAGPQPETCPYSSRFYARA